MQQPPGYFVDAFAGRDGYRLKDAVILGRDLRSDVLGVVGHGLGGLAGSRENIRVPSAQFPLPRLWYRLILWPLTDSPSANRWDELPC
jgi:hypothetical protein